jgi:hypothetical protein
VMRSDCWLGLLQTASGKIGRRLGQFKDRLTTAPAFTPDGRSLVTAAGGVVQVWEVATGGEICRRDGHRQDIWGLLVSADGRRLATQSFDGTVLIWDLGRLVAAAGLLVPGGAALEAPWSDLASPDAAIGRRGVETLIAAGAEAMPFLRQRLPQVTVVDAKALAGWIADLGSDVFESRQQAEEELARRDEAAGPALRQALAANPSLEARRRIERLLKKIEPPPVLPGHTLRSLRAVQALEGQDNAEALGLLQELSRGAAGARITDEAAAAVARLLHHAPSRER